MSLTIEKLCKKFGERVIFDNFSYKFDDVGIYVLKGESGIGKTTLLRIIAGLDKDYSGNVFGGGAKNVSFAFQEYRLFESISAYDNVYKVSVKEKNADEPERVRRLLTELNFSDEDMRKYPQELSGGMKQRISLARAFLKSSPILLLDEPTKELDEENISAVLKKIKSMGQERLIILVTHRSDDASFLEAKTIEI